MKRESRIIISRTVVFAFAKMRHSFTAIIVPGSQLEGLKELP